MATVARRANERFQTPPLVDSKRTVSTDVASGIVSARARACMTEFQLPRAFTRNERGTNGVDVPSGAVFSLASNVTVLPVLDPIDSMVVMSETISLELTKSPESCVRARAVSLYNAATERS